MQSSWMIPKLYRFWYDDIKLYSAAKIWEDGRLRRRWTINCILRVLIKEYNQKIITPSNILKWILEHKNNIIITNNILMLAPSREEFHKWCLLFALNHWIWHVFKHTSYTKHWLTAINNTHYEIGSVGGSLSEYMDDNDLENIFEILEAQQWWSSFVRSSSFVPLSTPTGSTFVMLFNMVTYKWSSVLSWNSIISSLNIKLSPNLQNTEQ